MKKDKSLIAINNRKGMKKILNNVVEFIKSTIKKDYILTGNSPYFLKQKRKLILKTIKADVLYLNQVSEDILLEELLQEQLPVNGIIYTAFDRGYTFSKDSTYILVSEYAKNAILQYVKMQKNTDDYSQEDLFTKRTSYLLENLDESLVQDGEFMKKLLDLASEKGYEITEHSPIYLKQNIKLLKNFGLLRSKYILCPELLKNEEFLESYINLMKQEGYDDETIINSLTYNEECTNLLKNDLCLFQTMFRNITPTNLEKFFNKFFSTEELAEILTEGRDLEGKLLRVSQLYARDKTVLKSLNGELLETRYQSIPNYKMQLMAKETDFQNGILSLNDFEYNLYNMISKLVSQKTDRWNRFEKNIIRNLSTDIYGELITDLYEQAKKGNKINTKDIEILTFLLSKETVSNNLFNITNKKELEYFEDIKELVCDTILINPGLDDTELIPGIKKYLREFEQLSELDRIKLAVLQKYYNIDLKEAEVIVSGFSYDIDNVPVNNEYSSNIVEQIKAIKNIFETNDINILNQITNLNILVQTDLASSTYLIEETKEIFEQLYKENLYMPKEEEKITDITYNGKSIEIFNANTDFSMFVKRIDNSTDENSQDIWNRITVGGKYESDKLRQYTCASYLTDEILHGGFDAGGKVTLGFAQGVKNYSIDAMYTSDARTSFVEGDSIYNDYIRGKYGGGVLAQCRYMTPSTLQTETGIENNALKMHNEVIINTLGIDENGQMTKMQPDYIVYIKELSDTGIEDLENDPVWEKSKKIASEFNIPIVIIDKEKVRDSEKTKIANMSEQIRDTKNIKDIWSFLRKVEHYIERYGKESISEYVSQDEIDSLRKHVEEQRANLVPNIKNNFAEKQGKITRKDVLRRQDNFKKRNIIGEER